MNDEPEREEDAQEGSNAESPVKRKFLTALVAYAILAGIGALTLDGKVRDAFLIMMLAFVAKTFIARKAGW